jgi:hypothetical protein
MTTRSRSFFMAAMLAVATARIDAGTPGTPFVDGAA